ncbi:MAG TPA: L,D-transpeptidase family protein [Methylomirabilota bacterium]
MTAAIVLLCASSASPADESAAGSVSPRGIRELVDRPAELRIDGQRLDLRALRRFYRPRGFAPAWEGNDGGPARASLLLQALATADAHGLDPERYHLVAIRARQASAGGRRATEIELLLTDAFLRYATDVRAGRRPAGSEQVDWGIPAPPFDAVSALTQGVHRPATFATLLASLPPPMKEYRWLVEGLRRYRVIAARNGWPPVPPGALLRPGDDDARVAALRARLAAEDELVSGTTGTRYDDRLEQGVRRFQTRHGLVADGIVGPATVGALNVAVADRIRQIALNLERWRWLPRDLGRHYVSVNAADATLQVVADGRAVLTSRVVVGDLRHPTPAVQARLDAVILNPPWNVPVSIAVEEILPRLRENRRYLAENDIVILERRESDPFGLAVDWSAIPSDPFPFRLQQRPGPDNPLGRIKFDVPNRFDVYLHDTPTRSLFGRPVRTASHGCIRVERAADLAVHVLADGTDRWTRLRLAEAIAAGDSPRIVLARPLPVYILYWTAFGAPDGPVQFRDDVYGRDRRLAAMLAAAAGAPAPAPPASIGGCPSPGKEAPG